MSGVAVGCLAGRLTRRGEYREHHRAPLGLGVDEDWDRSSAIASFVAHDGHFSRFPPMPTGTFRPCRQLGQFSRRDVLDGAEAGSAEAATAARAKLAKSS